MKFSVAVLLGVTSATLSRSQFLYNQLDALYGTVSEFDAHEKDPIFNRIAHLNDELTTLKGLVGSVDTQNYNRAMNLMEADMKKF
jgi:hypothetical protein